MIPSVLLLIGINFLNNKENVDFDAIQELNSLENKFIAMNKRMNKKTDFLKILVEIESFAKQNSVQIISIKQNKKSLHLNFQAKKENILKFVAYCEYFNSYSKIENLKINSMEGVLKNIQMQLSFKQYYYKKAQIQEEVNKSYLLKAIIGEYVLINNSWVELNQKFNEYRVAKIDINSIELTNDEVKIRLELFDEIK